MKKIIIVLATILLVGCTKDMESLTGFTVPSTARSLTATALPNFSATIKLYSDNGRTQIVLDSINFYVRLNARDTINPVSDYVPNDLAFVANNQELYSVGSTYVLDSLPFIIKNPTLFYYTMKITTINAPQGLYLFDGAGMVLTAEDITPTYTTLGEGTTKYSFSAQSNFGVSLSKRFALVHKS